MGFAARALVFGDLYLHKARIIAKPSSTHAGTRFN
jgi:hypothetical protein